MGKNVNLDIKEGIAELSLIKASKMNAFDEEFLKEIDQNINFLQTEDIKCLFIKGSKDFFSAGGDLDYISQMDKEEAVNASGFIQSIFNKIENSNFFTIGIIRGIAFGGGLELALSCDFCIASTDAKFALPEMKFGIIPAGGGTIRLTERSGFSSLAFLLTSSATISAEEALNFNIVQKVAEEIELNEIIKSISDNFDKINVEQVKEIKQHIKKNQKTGLADGKNSSMKQESLLFADLLSNKGKYLIKNSFGKNKNKS